MEDFLGLLFFLFFFFVLPLLQKKKAQQRQQNQQPAEFEVLDEPPTRSGARVPTDRSRPTASESRKGAPDQATPFQEALRQIREALEEAQQEHQPAPEPPRRQPTPTPRPPTRIPDPHPSPLPAPPPIRFDSPAGFEHERHGFGRENPLSEEAFEQRPAFSTASRRTKKPAFDPHGLRPTPPRPAPTTLLDKLRRPETARDALVLAEVLGPPKSSRGRPRR